MTSQRHTIQEGQHLGRISASLGVNQMKKNPEFHLDTSIFSKPPFPQIPNSSLRRTMANGNIPRQTQHPQPVIVPSNAPTKSKPLNSPSSRPQTQLQSPPASPPPPPESNHDSTRPSIPSIKPPQADCDTFKLSMENLQKSEWVSLEGLVSVALERLGKDGCERISELGM